MVADFVAHIGKKLPDDVVAKLEELGSQETAALPKALYETMTKNQKLAVELNRPSCQDTGVLQFWLKCGTNFPYINELEGLLKEAVVQATFAAPLRHNSVETFDEYNTKKNVGKGTPTGSDDKLRLKCVSSASCRRWSWNIHRNRSIKFKESADAPDRFPQ